MSFFQFLKRGNAIQRISTDRSGNENEIWIGDAPFNAPGNNSVADTAAFNLAMAKLLSWGDLTVNFEDKTYLCNGALQGINGYQSRWTVPAAPGFDWLNLKLKGIPSPIVVGSLRRQDNFDFPMPNHGTIIQSSVTTPGGAMLGSAIAGSSTFNRVTITVEDMLFRAAYDPQYTALDLRGFQQMVLEGVVQADNGKYSPDTTTEPTNSNSYGLRMPTFDNGALIQINGTFSASGFYYGVETTEHLVANQIIAHACKYAADYATANHASHVKDFLIQVCQNGLNFNNIPPGFTHPFTIDQMRIEHGNGSMGWLACNGTGRFDVTDTNNRGLGEIKRWWTAKTAAGIINEFFKSGGTGITATRIGA